MILLAVKSFFSLITLVLLTIIIHEGAHYVAALIMKVPIRPLHGLTLATWRLYSFQVLQNILGVKVVSYAGGLVTGLLLLVIVVLKREWFKQSLYHWLLGLYMATFGFWQICQGILEGAFHDMYIADATNIFSLSYCVGYTSAVLGMALYWVFMPGVKGLIAKEKYS